MPTTKQAAPGRTEERCEMSRAICDRFDCDLLCRAAGAMDSFTSHEGDEASKTRLKQMADEIFRAAVWLRCNGRDASLAPAPVKDGAPASEERALSPRNSRSRAAVAEGGAA